MGGPIVRLNALITAWTLVMVSVAGADEPRQPPPPSRRFPSGSRITWKRTARYGSRSWDARRMSKIPDCTRFRLGSSI